MLRFRTSLLLCLIAISTHASFFCRMHDYAFGNGLLQSHISNAQQDASGFMWFATWNGIVRFDGHTFNTF
jgi:ligand-binding sensor domain-containing protein